MKFVWVVVLLLVSLCPLHAQEAASFALVDITGRGVIDSVQWAESGKTLAVTTTTGVWLYQAEDLSQAPRHLPFDHSVTAAFSPTSATMAVAEDGGVALYDLTTGEKLYLLKAGYSVYRVLAFNRDGTRLAAVVDTNYAPSRDEYPLQTESFIHVWPIFSSEEAIQSENGPAPRIYIHPDRMTPHALAFSPDGKRLAVVASFVGFDYAEWEFFMIDLVTGDLLTSRDYYHELTNETALNDLRVVMGSFNLGIGHVIAVDPDPERFGLEILGHNERYSEVYAISDDARWAIRQTESGLEIQSTLDGATIARLPDEEFRMLTFSPDKTRFAAVSEGRLSVYDISQLDDYADACGATQSACVTYTDAHIPQLVITNPMAPHSVASEENVLLDEGVMSPSGEWRLLYLREEKQFYLVNQQTEINITLTIDIDSPYMRYLQFSPDESLLALSFTTYYMGGTGDTVVKVWDLSDSNVDPDPIATLEHHDEMGPMLFSPDGTLLVTTSTNGEVFVWDTATWTKLIALPHPGEVLQLLFSEDSQTLTTLADDGLVRVWKRRD